MAVLGVCSADRVSGLCSGMDLDGSDQYYVTAQVEHKYMLLSGVIGAFITITVVKSMGSLGPARAAMLIVTSQVIVAYLIELFGLFGVDKQPFMWRKVIGMVISIAGIILFKW